MGQEASTEVFDADIPPKKLWRRDLSSVAHLIRSGEAKKVVFLVGAGISTAAGIPDFRSPETGLYSNLSRLGLDRPECVFDISFFRTNPVPFYTLASELWPGKYKPTMTHIFMRMFSARGLLLKVFTQNIDTLELAAGIPEENIIFAHGSFKNQHCIDCGDEFPRAKLEEHVMRAEPAYCRCGGLVKPDITFFGEALPREFHDGLDLLEDADLAFVMGSSLSVYPFAALPQRVNADSPRVLLNMERVGEIGSRREDVVWLGECDDGVRELAEELGWVEEMEQIWKSMRGLEPIVDESLESQVDRLTNEVEKTLRVAEDHNEWVSKKLEKEIVEGVPAKKEESGLGHVFPHLKNSD